MLNGARPGERRGGRKKGTPYKATRERALLGQRILEEQQGRPGRKLAREVLDEFMHLFMGMAAAVAAPREGGLEVAPERSRGTTQGERAMNSFSAEAQQMCTGATVSAARRTVLCASEFMARCRRRRGR